MRLHSCSPLELHRLRPASDEEEAFHDHRGPDDESHSSHPHTSRTSHNAILTHSQVDILFRKSSLPKLLESLGEGEGALQYARVHMKLSDIIEGDLFNHYVKAGNEG